MRDLAALFTVGVEVLAVLRMDVPWRYLAESRILLVDSRLDLETVAGICAEVLPLVISDGLSEISSARRSLG